MQHPPYTPAADDRPALARDVALILDTASAAAGPTWPGWALTWPPGPAPASVTVAHVTPGADPTHWMRWTEAERAAHWEHLLGYALALQNAGYVTVPDAPGGAAPVLVVRRPPAVPARAVPPQPHFYDAERGFEWRRPADYRDETAPGAWTKREPMGVEGVR